MSEPSTGHNSKEQLRSITERINRLEDEKKEASDAIRDICAEAKGNGLNPKAIRAVVRRQRQDAKALAEFEADVELYMSTLGMESL